jgi:hypothetical protein
MIDLPIAPVYMLTPELLYGQSVWWPVPLLFRVPNPPFPERPHVLLVRNVGGTSGVLAVFPGGDPARRPDRRVFEPGSEATLSFVADFNDVDNHLLMKAEGGALQILVIHVA